MRLAVLINSTALTHILSHTQSATQIQIEEATPKKSRSNKGVDSGCVSGLDSSGSKKHKHFSANGDRSPKNAKGGSKTQRQLQHTQTHTHAGTSLITQTQARGAVLDKSCVKVF